MGALAAFSILFLTGCIAAPVTATGSGVVTIAWASRDGDPPGAAAYSPETGGDRLALCAPDVGECTPSTGPILYFYDPTEGATSAVLAEGTSVLTPAGQEASVPAGRYVLQAVGYNSSGQSQAVGALLSIYLGSVAERDLTVWHQSVERSSQDSTCSIGFTPSWAEWPHEGKGGFVCNRQVYAYYPDEPVPAEGQAPNGPAWLQSYGRESADQDCAEGYRPSWAQWPGEGQGGYTCEITNS